MVIEDRVLLGVRWMEHLNVREFNGMGTFLALWVREIEGLEFHVWRMRKRGENFGHDLWESSPVL